MGKVIIMGNGHSFDTYYNWTFLFPTVICSVAIFLTFVFIFINFLMYREKPPDIVIKMFYLYAKIVFRDALKMEEGKILLHNYDIPVVYFAPFSGVITLFVVCVFIFFWASFLIEETFICDPLLDCFMSNSSTSSVERVTDCALLQRNTSVVCYNFVLNTTEGLSSAVGFLAVSVIYIYIYGYLLEFLIGIFMSDTSKSATKWCAGICWGLIIILPMILGVIFINIVFMVPSLNEIALKTNESSLKTYAYWTYFVYVGPIAVTCISFAILASTLKWRRT